MNARAFRVDTYTAATCDASDDNVCGINLLSLLIEHHDVGLTNDFALDDDRAVRLCGNICYGRLADDHGPDRDRECDQPRSTGTDLDGSGALRLSLRLSLTLNLSQSGR